MLIDKSKLFEDQKPEFEEADLWKIYRQGFFTNLLNPKIAIFFLSLLPQFIKPAYVNNSVPFLILGGTFLLTGTIWCLFLAYSASFMTNTLRGNDRIGKIMKKVSGTIFIGLGLQLLMNKSN